uniref:Uncharacterized protein n=1 Tax=Ditylenchus dipsaci TaxID=166011 RepID=A0A915ESM4_9BILA
MEKTGSHMPSSYYGMANHVQQQRLPAPTTITNTPPPPLPAVQSVLEHNTATATIATSERAPQSRIICCWLCRGVVLILDCSVPCSNTSL